MTDTQPPMDDGLKERLTGLADGLRHFREIFEIRQQQTNAAIQALNERNRKQDEDLEAVEERLQGAIAEIYTLLWSGMRWGAGLLAVTLLTVVLKTLHLV
jgi:broad specificity phosphatase PhoE